MSVGVGEDLGLDLEYTLECRVIFWIFMSLQIAATRCWALQY